MTLRLMVILGAILSCMACNPTPEPLRSVTTVESRTVGPAVPPAPVTIQECEDSFLPMFPGMKPPLVKRVANPVYPELIRRAPVVGNVVVDVYILASGTVCAAHVTAGLEPQLDKEVVAAVQQWEFSPAEVGGKPVAAVISITVRVDLSRT